MQDKEKLRQSYQVIRKEIVDKDLKSKIIIDHLIKQPIVKEAKMIGCFAGLTNEVQTLTLLTKGLNLCFPRVIGKNMMFYAVNNIEELHKGSFGILEPNDTCPLIDIEQIDIMLIPCVALDLDGNRIGYGQGYYDRYLKNYSRPKIALCFADNVSAQIFPCEEHDIKMNMYVDEHGFHRI